MILRLAILHPPPPPPPPPSRTCYIYCWLVFVLYHIYLMIPKQCSLSRLWEQSADNCGNTNLKSAYHKSWYCGKADFLWKLGQFISTKNGMGHYWTDISVVVNFDALAQASDIQIERRQVVFLCWMQDLNLGSQTPNRQQTECSLTNRLSYRGSS